MNLAGNGRNLAAWHEQDESVCMFENCNFLYLVIKKLTWRLFCNAGADEKPGNYFICGLMCIRKQTVTRSLPSASLLFCCYSPDLMMASYQIVEKLDSKYQGTCIFQF